MAALNPPGGRGVITVADDDVDRYLAAGWQRAEDQSGSTAFEAEETVKVTETGGPEADDEDREFVATIVSDDLGDESVLSTDFGREGDEPVKGGTEPLQSAGDVEGQVETGTRPAPAEPEPVSGNADIDPSPEREAATAAQVAEVSGDEPVKPKTTRSRAK